MKKQSQPQVPPPSDPKVDPSETLRMPRASALEPSEITLVLLDSEGHAASAESSTSTVAVGIQELNQAVAPEGSPRLPHPGTEAPWGAPAPQGTIPPPSSARGSMKLWLGLVLVAGGLATYWFLRPTPLAPSAPEATLQGTAQAAPEAVPPELRSYLEQAKGGDAKAMHMLALMYWNGLNVRQDRVKGLEWYRKSAAAGDPAARKELQVIEGK